MQRRFYRDPLQWPIWCHVRLINGRWYADFASSLWMSLWMKNPVHRFPSSMLILIKRRSYALVLSMSCTATPHRAHQGHLTSNRRTEPVKSPVAFESDTDSKVWACQAPCVTFLALIHFRLVSSWIPYALLFVTTPLVPFYRYFLLPQYSWVWKNKRRCKMLCLSIDERMYSQLSNRHGPVPHMPGLGE